MPHTVELWQAVKTKQYDQVKNLINTYPDENLVNAVNSSGSSLLMNLLGLKPLPTALIQFIAEHKDLNLSYINPEDEEVNLEAVLGFPNKEIFAMFGKRTDIFYNGEALSYVYVNRCVTNAKKSYEIESKKNPSSESTKRQAERVANLESILKTLGELTIRYAVEKDDDAMLDKLEKAGCNLSTPLSDGTKPVHLLKKSNIKAGAWFNLRAERIMVKVNLSDSPHTMEMFKAKSDELAALTVAHKKKQGDLYSKAADEGLDSLNRVVSALQ